MNRYEVHIYRSKYIFTFFFGVNDTTYNVGPSTGWLFSVYLDSQKVNILLEAVMRTLLMLYLPYRWYHWERTRSFRWDIDASCERYSVTSGQRDCHQWSWCEYWWARFIEWVLQTSIVCLLVDCLLELILLVTRLSMLFYSVAFVHWFLLYVL